MRRAAFAAALLLASTVYADQGWQDNQDGSGFICYDVGTLQVNNLIGSGTRCVQVTSSGELIASSTACGTPLTAGTGITFVGGTAVTSNLSTGVSGGQSVIGGTATTDSLTIKATSASPAGGAHINLQTTNDYWDAANEGFAFDGPTPISMYAAGEQNIYKTGGPLWIGTNDSNLVNFITNGNSALTINATQTIQVATLASGGTQCVQASSGGVLSGTGAPCGSGAGAVNSVTGTPLRVSATPTTGAVVVDTIGGLSTGAITGGNIDLGAGNSGTLQQTVTAGVASVTEFAGTTNDIPYYIANSQLAQDALFFWDPTHHVLDLGGTQSSPVVTTNLGTITAGLALNFFASGANSGVLKTGGGSMYFGTDPSSNDVVIDVTGHAVMDIDTGLRFNWGGIVEQAAGLTMSEWDNRPPSTPTAATLKAVHRWDATPITVTGTTHVTGAEGFFYLDSPTVTDASSATVDNFATFTANAPTCSGSLTCTQKPAIRAKTGSVMIDVLASTPVLGADSAGNIKAATPGTDYQVPLTACTDYVSLSCVTGTTDLGGTNATPTVIGIENDGAMRGDILATTIAAPSSPSAGKVRIYADSTFSILNAKNSTGSVSHTVVNTTCSTSQFMNQMTAAGLALCAQPAFSDLAGSATCAQLPALTGGVTSPGGSCATTLNITPTTCGANTFGTSVSGVGALTCTQPAFSNLSGSASCAQLPALTGAITSGGGTCATSYAGMPTAGRVDISAGATSAPTSDSTYTFDTALHVQAAGNAIGINGVSVPSNVNLCVGHTTASDRDRSQFFIGGGSLGPSTAGTDSTLFDVFPSNTTINLGVGVLGGIYATQRIRSLTYPGGGIGCAVGVAASLYIDAAPTLVVAAGATYGLYVASGAAHVGGAIDSGSTVSGHSVVATGTAGTAISANGDVGPTLGFFGASPLGQQTGGAATAGGTYTATEAAMINRMYAAMRAYGLLN